MYLNRGLVLTLNLSSSAHNLRQWTRFACLIYCINYLSQDIVFSFIKGEERICANIGILFLEVLIWNLLNIHIPM